MNWRSFTLTFTLLLLSLLPAQAAPWQGLSAVGRAEMTWLWFKLYDARLYSADGRYVPKAYPQVLRLTYARDISRADLLKATLEEWQRQGLGTPAQRTRWLAALTPLWPDVASGDELIFFVPASGIGEFWDQRQRLGVVNDPAFAPAFLAIWLSDNSLAPATSRQLRGLRN
ncbi:MAG: chalcone isomerase family protein [Aeromonas sp.]